MGSSGLQWTRPFFSHLMQFSGPKFWCNKVHQVFFPHFEKPNVFQWTDTMKILALQGKIFFQFWSSKVHLVQYTAIMDLVYFSGPTIQENLALKVTSGSTKVHQPGPLKYTCQVGTSIYTSYIQYAANMDLVYFGGPTIQDIFLNCGSTIRVNPITVLTVHLLLFQLEVRPGGFYNLYLT